MNAVVLDTLQLSRRLEAAGMPTAQAQGVAAALGESLAGQLATERDIGDLKRDLGVEVEATRQALRAQVEAVRAELKAEIEASRAETREAEARLRAETRQAEARLQQQIEALRAELKLDGAALRTELKADNASLRAELKADNAALRTDLATLRKDMEAMEQRITIRMGGMIAGGVVLIGILIKLL